MPVQLHGGGCNPTSPTPPRLLVVTTGVYAHIYHSHFRQIISLGAEAHLNSCFKHFIAFVLEFMLVDRRELSPLKELIESMLGSTAILDGTCLGTCTVYTWMCVHCVCMVGLRTCQ